MSQEFLFQQKTALLHVMKQEDEAAVKLRVFASIHRSTLKTCSHKRTQVYELSLAAHLTTSPVFLQ